MRARADSVGQASLDSGVMLGAVLEALSRLPHIAQVMLRNSATASVDTGRRTPAAATQPAVEDVMFEMYFGGASNAPATSGASVGLLLRLLSTGVDSTMTALALGGDAAASQSRQPAFVPAVVALLNSVFHQLVRNSGASADTPPPVSTAHGAIVTAKRFGSESIGWSVGSSKDAIGFKVSEGCAFMGVAMYGTGSKVTHTADVELFEGTTSIGTWTVSYEHDGTAALQMVRASCYLWLVCRHAHSLLCVCVCLCVDVDVGVWVCGWVCRLRSTTPCRWKRTPTTRCRCLPREPVATPTTAALPR